MPAGLKRGLLFVIGLSGVLFSALGLARFSTVHNETFDLAMYTRLAWGMARLDGWEPIMNAHFAGLHLSWVLWPLGWLGRGFGTAQTLLVAQGFAVAAATWPLAKMAYRHGGTSLAITGALAWLLYPNLSHVVSYEFHPGTLAVLPIAWMLEGIDRDSVATVGWASLGVLACREDLALVVAAGWLLMAWLHPARRSIAVAWTLLSCVYVAVFVLWLLPTFGPEHGSLQAHFSHLDQGVLAWFGRLGSSNGLTYLPRVLLPVAGLSIVRPKWLLVALPTFALGLLSQFPTTTELYSHYLTPAVPVVVAAAILGVGRLRGGRWPIAALVLATIAGYLMWGGGPGAAGFDHADFEPDDRTRASVQVLSLIGELDGVQAPDPLLAHLAERPTLARAVVDAGDRNMTWVIFDLVHRQRYPANAWPTTVQEPPIQRWSARPDRTIAHEDNWWLLLRTSQP